MVIRSRRAGVVLEVLGVERDELRRVSAAANPSQQQRAVAQPGQRGGVDRLEQPREGVELERLGLAWRSGRVPCWRRIPDKDGGNGAGVARVGVVLGAVRGGDRGGAAGDRDRPELAVGLGGQERATVRRRGHRLERVLGAPGGEGAPVVLVRAAGGRRERRGGVAGGPLELAPGRHGLAGCAGHGC